MVEKLKENDMGNFNISIHGTGIHHNDNPKDADVMAKKFVDELEKAGHTITDAKITIGGTDTLVRNS